jgi:hypothetical protein
VTWGEMSARQRLGCVVFLGPAMLAYGLMWCAVKGCRALGLD